MRTVSGLVFLPSSVSVFITLEESLPRGRELAEDLEGKQALPLDPTAVAECEGGTMMHGVSTCLFGLGFSGSNWGGNTSHIPEAGLNRPLRLPCCLFRSWRWL